MSKRRSRLLALAVPSATALVIAVGGWVVQLVDDTPQSQQSCIALARGAATLARTDPTLAAAYVSDPQLRLADDEEIRRCGDPETKIGKLLLSAPRNP